MEAADDSRMKVLNAAALLVLLVLSADAVPVAQECDLPEKVQQDNLHKVMAVDWVLVEAFADYQEGVEMMTALNSSQLLMLFDNTTKLFVERNVMGGKCLVFGGNMSLPGVEASNHTLVMVDPGIKEYEGRVAPYYDHGKADIYLPHPDSMIMTYHVLSDGAPGRQFLIYRRDGKHLDVDKLEASRSYGQKMAACLDFKGPSQFVYDGKSDFCLKKTTSA